MLVIEIEMCNIFKSRIGVQIIPLDYCLSRKSFSSAFWLCYSNELELVVRSIKIIRDIINMMVLSLCVLLKLHKSAQLVLCYIA